jgi:hypothetical protein
LKAGFHFLPGQTFRLKAEEFIQRHIQSTGDFDKDAEREVLHTSLNFSEKLIAGVGVLAEFLLSPPFGFSQSADSATQGNLFILT